MRPSRISCSGSHPLLPAGLLLLGSILFCPCLPAQEDPSTALSAPSAENAPLASARSEAGLATSSPTRQQIHLPIWVEQEDARAWTVGRSGDFQVFLNDQETPIRSFQGPQSPSVLLVVFDTIADLARVEQARTALTETLSRLPENSWVGLLRAQNGLSVLQEPTADRNLVAEKIRAIQLGGKAGLLDVLEMVSLMATEILKKARIRIQILYITDAGIGDYRADYLNPVINAGDSGDLSRRFSDRAVRERMDRQAETLNRFTIPIFVVHLQYSSDPLNLAYISGLEKISSDTAGIAAFCRSIEEIQPAIEKVLNRFQTGYQAVIDAPADLHRMIKVRVDLKNRAGKQNSRIIYPESIFPAGPAGKNPKS